jgi:hypothetical protein
MIVSALSTLRGRPQMFQGFTYVDWWKALAVVFTATFAVIGLISDPRNKHTGRLTKWGLALLVGICLSAAGGLLAQIKESADDVTKHNEEIEEQKILDNEILAILDNNKATLYNLKRLLLPLNSPPKILASLSVNCETQFHSFCIAANNIPGILSREVFNFWPAGQSGLIGMNLHFYANENDAIAHIDELDLGAKYNLGTQFRLLAGNEVECGFQVDRHMDKSISLSIPAPWECGTPIINNPAHLQSYLDLEGLTIGVTAAAWPPPGDTTVRWLEPIFVSLMLPDGEVMGAANFKKLDSPTGNVLYIAPLALLTSAPPVR